MSSESFAAFVARLDEDKALREQLRAAGGDQGLRVEALADFAKAHGYEFTADDVTGELSEKQLEAVAGGLARTFSVSTTFDKVSPVLSVSYLNGYLFKIEY
jgi:predicted ribosomally synthesized peptide with nif11-like leader